MDKPARFEFITAAEFANLDLAQRDRYLRSAIKELDRQLAAMRPRGAANPPGKMIFPGSPERRAA